MRMALAGCGKTIAAQQNFDGRTSRTSGTHHAGCSTKPSSKATASEEAQCTLRYIVPLGAARTPLAVFFSILLVQKHNDQVKPNRKDHCNRHGNVNVQPGLERIPQSHLMQEIDFQLSFL